MSGIILVWVIGGIFSGAGALTLAELGAMLPQAGGLYVYLRVAYGALLAFLFGWVEFLIVRSGSMATLAAAFARYFAGLVPAPEMIRTEIWQAGAASLAIAFVTAVNVLGTRRGGTLQVVGTVLKVGGLLVLISLPAFLGAGNSGNLTPMWPTSIGRSVFSGMMAAMVSVLWAYDGWTNVTPLAEEIREPGTQRSASSHRRNGGIDRRLSRHDARISLRDAHDGNRRCQQQQQRLPARGGRPLLQPAPGLARICGVSLLVMCSTFISLNGNALTGPRAYFAMARDGLFPAGLCRIHSRFQTPANAVLSQGVWAITLMVAGTFLHIVPPSIAPGCPR